MNLDTSSFLNRYSVGGVALIGLIALGVTSLTGFEGVENSGMLQGVNATVYKSPDCGCCAAWAQYAEKQGINVEVKEVRTLRQIKSEHRVPSSLESCHTTVLRDYVVEGHIPAESIEKMLEDEPEVQGIGLPGMPQGSPGMPGQKQGDWEISSFTENGETSKFMTV